MTIVYGFGGDDVGLMVMILWGSSRLVKEFLNVCDTVKESLCGCSWLYVGVFCDCGVVTTGLRFSGILNGEIFFFFSFIDYMGLCVTI